MNELHDPVAFDLKLSDGKYQLMRGETRAKFCAPASTRGIAKLYTLSDGPELLYVGIAQQPMSARLSFGMRANGKSGYWGYKWKDLEKTVRLAVWTASGHDPFVSLREMETVEAEVAFLCRKESGQWPRHQHEIHFYPSDAWHREAAKKIYEFAVRGRADD